MREYIYDLTSRVAEKIIERISKGPAELSIV